MKIKFTFNGNITSDHSIFREALFTSRSFGDNATIEKVLLSHRIFNNLTNESVNVIENDFQQEVTPDHAPGVKYVWYIKYIATSKTYVCAKIIDENKFVCYLNDENKELIFVNVTGMKIFVVED